MRSGTSIGAHYREEHRAKSDADIANKFETALQELDETDYWLELLVRAQIVPAQKIEPLRKETGELCNKNKESDEKEMNGQRNSSFLPHPSSFSFGE